MKMSTNIKKKHGRARKDTRSTSAASFGKQNKDSSKLRASGNKNSLKVAHGRQNKEQPEPDTRRVIRFRYFLNKATIRLLEVYYPRLRFEPGNKIHLHPILHYSRIHAEEMIFNKIASKRYCVLDVGFSLRNCGRHNVHGCEDLQKGGVHAKYRVLKAREDDRHRACETTRTWTGRKNTWTWCTHSALECECFGFDVALFTHSIYYNTPAEIGKILLNTKKRRGYAVMHRFPNDVGTFVDYPTHSEARYVKTGDRVTMQVHGNNHSYTHYSCDWMLGRAAMKVEIEGVSYALHWEQTPTETAGVTWLVEFDIFEYEGSMPQVIPMELNSGDPDVGTIVLLEAKQNFLTKFWNDARGVKNKVHRVPKVLLAKAKSHFTGKTVCRQTEKDLVVKLRNLFRTRNCGELEQMGVSSSELIDSIPVVKEHVIDSVMANHRTTFGWNSISRNIQMFFHNYTIMREPFSFLLPTLLFIGLPCLVGSLLVLGLMKTMIIATMILLAPHVGGYKLLAMGCLMYFVIPYVSSERVFPPYYRGEWVNIGGSPTYVTQLGKEPYANTCVAPTASSAVNLEAALILGYRWLSPYHDAILGALLFLVQFLTGTLAACLTVSYFVTRLFNGAVVLPMVGLIPAELAAGMFAPFGPVPGFCYYFIRIGLIMTAIRWFSRFDAWDRFKRSCNILLQPCYAQGRVRPGDGLDAYETDIDPGKFPMSKDSTLKIRDEITQKPSYIGMVLGGIGFCNRVPIVCSTSTHNLLRSIQTRLVLEVPTGKPEAWKEVDDLLINEPKMLCEDEFPTSGKDPYDFYGHHIYEREVQTFEQYLSRYNKSKAAKIRKAKARLDEGGLDYSHFCFSVFVKREKLTKLSLGGICEPLRPRPIQGCSEYHKAAGGTWFLKYSDSLKHMWGPKHWIFYCSGRRADLISVWFKHHLLRLGGEGDVVFVGTDFSKYDSTQGKSAIIRECKNYRRLGVEKLPYGRHILRSKIRTTGYGGGVKYTIRYRRKSGELDTSSGNSRLTGDTMAAFFLKNGLNGKHVSIAVLGDDNFIIINYKAFRSVWKTFKQFEADLHRHYTDLGFVVKIVVTDSVIEGEYLSSRFYPVGEDYLLGRKPGRTMAKLGWYLAKAGAKPSTYLGYLYGTLKSMKGVGMHVPFLRVYLVEIMNYLEITGVTPITPEMDWYKVTGGEARNPTNETWVAFEDFYGLGRQQERHFRSQIRTALFIYGLPCIIYSEYLEKMVAVDQNM